MANQILLVDDDRTLTMAVSAALERDHRVQVVADALQCRQALLHGPKVDLIILDLMLPGTDGLSLCRELRAQTDVPLLIISSLGEESDKVVGLEMGADDYLAKPFGLSELRARVRALLRRSQRAESASEVLCHGDLEMDLGRRVARRGVHPLNLTMLEFSLLHFLLRRPGFVFTRRDLLDRIWGPDFLGDERVVDAHVRNLRRKLGPGMIETVRGLGYKIEG